MQAMELSANLPRPIGVGSRLTAFLAGSAALGSLIIALLVVLADLDDEWDDTSGFDEDPDEEPARPSSSRRPSRRG
jgi:hypothetical protein